MKPVCSHPRTQRMRVITRDGETHVADVCLDCDTNARGPNRWVPRGQQTERPADLPLWRDLRTPEEKGEQPELF